ncbi:SDR family oxidoreductase [Vibrio sp. JC009]|uniref:SDR family oxidoreductase n=1 Tax=Vibrio sp. JC009 TaxID=2912314 RepID=UPI0023AF5B67|nr:SDR family oxidoreductase [Vibrio sp. JC009]WED20938.1 SDR family oxidoreductase [Vibrio sp. JC009]
MDKVLITGANRGIGLALVKQYLNSGWEVFATYRDAESASELLALTKQHPQLSSYQLDVTDYPAIEALQPKLPAIDLLINNAGYYGPKGYGFGNTDVEEWRKVFEINSIAPLKLVETLYPNLLQGRLKRVACISSKVGSMTENTSGGGYIYRSSKAAVNSVVKSLSNDLSKEDFTVVALHPGWVLTEMGGPNALISTEVSTEGLFSVIDKLKPEDSGRFLNYDGTEIAW